MRGRASEGEKREEEQHVLLKKITQTRKARYDGVKMKEEAKARPQQNLRRPRESHWRPCVCTPASASRRCPGFLSRRGDNASLSGDFRHYTPPN